MTEKIRDIGEFGLIGRISDLLDRDGIRSERVTLGIGDDTASFLPRPGYEVLVTCDAMVEGRHYLSEHISPFDLGRRAMTVNISDIGAMGGRPVYALISLGLKAEMLVHDVEEMYRGFLAELNPFKACYHRGQPHQIRERDVHRHHPHRGGGAGERGAPFRGEAWRCHPGYRLSGSVRRGPAALASRAG